LNANFGTISASAYAMVYLFQGARWDPAVNQYIMGERVLLPTVQRWAQGDPIVYGGGDTNYYRFVGNGPIGSTDPSGLENVGHHWITQKMLEKLFIDKKITEAAYKHWMGITSRNVGAHNYGTKYKGVSHDMYSKRVMEILDDLVAANKRPLTLEQLTEVGD